MKIILIALRLATFKLSIETNYHRYKVEIKHKNSEVRFSENYFSDEKVGNFFRVF